MNIIFFTDSVSARFTYGNAVRTASIARSLQSLGHKVSIICSRHDKTQSLLDPSFYDLVYLDWRLGPLNFILSLLRLFTFLKHSDFAVLALFWEPTHIIFYLINRFFSIKYVLMPNGALPPYGHSLLIKSLYMRFFGKSLVNKTSAIFAVTHREAHELTEYFNFVSFPPFVRILPNGLDLCCFPAEDSKVSSLDNQYIKPCFKITYLGRLSCEKGVDILIRAFALLLSEFPCSNLVLSIAGPDFGEVSHLKELIYKLSLPPSSVDFLGSLSGTDKINFLSTSSLHVVPSRREAMSLVALEAAFYSQSQVIVTYECGLHDFQSIADYFVFSDASVDSLFSAMRLAYLENSSSDFRGKMNEFVDNRRSVITSSFSWDSVALSLESSLNDILV